jgi:hypothetical protein
LTCVAALNFCHGLRDANMNGFFGQVRYILLTCSHNCSARRDNLFCGTTKTFASPENKKCETSAIGSIFPTTAKCKL